MTLWLWGSCELKRFLTDLNSKSGAWPNSQTTSEQNRLASLHDLAPACLGQFATVQPSAKAAQIMATPQSILDKIALIKTKRSALVRLLDQPNLGTLRIDVNQALEEIDDLMDEFEQTFPDAA